MAALATDPTAILLDVTTFSDLKFEIGDSAEVLLAARTESQKLRTMKVAGRFTRFPGFPERVHIIVNLDYYQSQTGLRDAGYFLARTTAGGHSSLAAATAALAAGPGAHDALNIDTTETTFNKDQSSLTALNIRGLVDLNSLYTLLISTAVIAIFVFGLMLQRRREFVTLRAQGLSSGRLHAVILGEAAFVGLCGLAAGLLVGGATGVLLVHVLPPLFILPPVPILPLGRVAVLASLVVAATVCSTLAAQTIIRRLSPSEVLREQ
jgi:hypothetical protein